MKIRNPLGSTLVLLIAVMAIVSCSSDEDGGGQCDMVANANEASFFKVVNDLSTGLQWSFTNSYPFGADMKPGECTIMGVTPSQYTIRFQQCNIGDGPCTSSFGPERMYSFSVSSGDTHSVYVDGAFFN